MRRERPERAASPQPRATPWVPGYKALRPVRAKVWANGCLLLLPLQGAGAVRTLTQGVALGSGLVGLSARAGPPVCTEPQKIRLIRIRRPRAARQFVNSFNSLLRRLRPTPNCGAAPQPCCQNSINSNLPPPTPLKIKQLI